MRISRLLGWSLLFAMSCKFEASCGSNDNLLNTRKGEKVIADWLEQQGIPAETITCPRDIKMIKGTVFTCQAVIAESDGLQIDIKVTQTSEDGDVSLEHTVPLQIAERVERGLAGQILDRTGQKVQVNCGKRARFFRPGDTFRCKVRGAEESYEFEIRDGDDQDAWQAKRI